MGLPTLDRRTGAPARKVALVAGAFFVITFISSIAGLLLYDPVLNDSDYIVGAGADTRVTLGALCEVILVIANIGTALALFPILKRQSEGLALGYVASRVVESTIKWSAPVRNVISRMCAKSAFWVSRR